MCDQVLEPIAPLIQLSAGYFQIESVIKLNMSRKHWSNLFLILALINLVLALLPANPARIIDWIALPCCLAFGALARRTMV